MRDRIRVTALLPADKSLPGSAKVEWDGEILTVHLLR